MAGDRIDPWIQVVRELGPTFAQLAASKDLAGEFVHENYTAMKEHKLFSAAVPTELGGGGASHGQICEMLRELAHYCQHRVIKYPKARNQKSSK